MTDTLRADHQLSEDGWACSCGRSNCEISTLLAALDERDATIATLQGERAAMVAGLDTIEFTLEHAAEDPTNGHIPIWAREDLKLIRQWKLDLATATAGSRHDAAAALLAALRAPTPPEKPEVA